jgi:hypothetical protein
MRSAAADKSRRIEFFASADGGAASASAPAPVESSLDAGAEGEDVEGEVGVAVEVVEVDFCGTSVSASLRALREPPPSAAIEVCASHELKEDIKHVPDRDNDRARDAMDSRFNRVPKTMRRSSWDACELLNIMLPLANSVHSNGKSERRR